MENNKALCDYLEQDNKEINTLEEELKRLENEISLRKQTREIKRAAFIAGYSASCVVPKPVEVNNQDYKEIFRTYLKEQDKKEFTINEIKEVCGVQSFEQAVIIAEELHEYLLDRTNFMTNIKSMNNTELASDTKIKIIRQ